MQLAADNRNRSKIARVCASLCVIGLRLTVAVQCRPGQGGTDGQNRTGRCIYYCTSKYLRVYLGLYKTNTHKATLTHGCQPGNQAILVQPFQPFRPMDLPMELRTIIYNLVLIKPTPTPIQIVSFKVPSRDRRPVQRGRQLRIGHEGLTWDKQQGKWLRMAPSSLAITQVNREVSAEALEVVYGSNTFVFPETSDMDTFIRTIGSNERFVRYHEVPGESSWTDKRSSKIFRSLPPLANLRSIKINHRVVCSTLRAVGGVTFDGFISDVMPFLRALHNTIRQKDLSYTVLDVVKFVQDAQVCSGCGTGGHCRYRSVMGTCQVPCRGAQMDRHCEELQGRLTALLVKELEIAQTSPN